MSGQYFPPYGGTGGTIKVELDLTNYATKQDVKNITHVDVSSYASKTNLAAVKTEVDKIDTDKLKTVPADLAKLTNAVKNELVKKTDYNTKVASIEAEIQGVNKNALNNLADIKVLKTKTVDTSNFVSKTKFSADTNALLITSLATKTSLSNYLTACSFNTKVTEIENKIKTAEGKIPSITNLATKTEVTAVENKIPDVTGYATKIEVASDIATIKNDYVTNASLATQLNDLKAQHIASEVKKVDDKAKKKC